MRLEKVIEFICGELGADSSRVDEYTLLGEVCRDETEAAELSLAIESEYGIELNEELDPDMTIGEFFEMIESLF